MARIPDMNDEAVALITCHEVGHLLGGGPYFKLENYKILSSEGQADYYSASVCLKKYFKGQADTILELGKVYDLAVLNICKNNFKEDIDVAVCLRSFKGAIAFTKALPFMQYGEPLASISLKDTSIVAETLYDSYPSHQCRLDTFMAGILGKDRPSCWFKE